MSTRAEEREGGGAVGMDARCGLGDDHRVGELGGEKRTHSGGAGLAARVVNNTRGAGPISERVLEERIAVGWQCEMAVSDF